MSRAFVKEDRVEPPVAPARPPLPDGVPNYVTKEGLALLRGEAIELEQKRAELERERDTDARREALSLLTQRRLALEARIQSAVVMPQTEGRVVRFGARVTVRGESGEAREYRIVGVDEAAPSAGKIAFLSPLARALLGRERGEVVKVTTPRGEEELEILDVAPE